MEKIYIIVLMVLVAVIIGCCIAARRKKNEYSGVIFRLLIAAMTAMVSYILFLVSDNVTEALIFDGIYFAYTDWMLLCMLAYVYRYTDTKIHIKWPHNICLFLAGFDTLNMMVNVQTGHMFTLKSAIHGETGHEYWSATFSKYHYWHLDFCYFLAALVLIFLFTKYIKSSKMYRKKYMRILTTFVVVLLVNGVCYTMDYPIDFSLAFYAVLAIIICYYTFYAVPKRLVEDTLVSVVEDFNNGIFCFDDKGRYIYANTKAAEYLGTRVEEHLVFEQYYQKWEEQNIRETIDYDEWEETHVLDGAEHHFRAEFQRVKDEHGTTTGYAFKLSDRTEEIRRFHEEQYAATHDRLTGMYNQEYFFRKAEQILARSPEVERYMVCTDINDFKLINDLFGEETGDRAVVNQASLLRTANYADCIQGRISESRFAMLVSSENFNLDMTVQNTGRLKYLIHDSNHKIQVLVGIYKVEDSAEAPRAMYEKAVMALEAAGGEHNKTVVYYDERMLKRVMHGRTVVSDFEYALRQKQLEMYLQPIADMSGRVKGAEALVRWRHYSKGLLTPGEFLPMVEKAGLILKLDEYMWNLAAERLCRWKKLGIDDMTISVNISARDFYYTDLSRVFIELVEKYDISPQKLNLEITEALLETEVEDYLRTVEKLQEYGFRIWIDDFGKDRSSIRLLKSIKADVLKMDKSFFGDAEISERSGILLRSAVNMAEALGMTVIAEGVETAGQLEGVRRAECQAFQGFYLSEPIPAEQFEENYFEGRNGK